MVINKILLLLLFQSPALDGGRLMQFFSAEHMIEKEGEKKNGERKGKENEK